MRLDACWTTRNPVSVLLLPLAGLFIALAALRRFAYRVGVLRVTRLPVPVIVVGNINVGGSGKTPLTIELVRELRRAGFRPGVVSRGYGGSAASWPRRVTPDGDPRDVGDEPVLIAREARCPVAVAPARAAAAHMLLQDGSCDVIVCDDGLQHYALARDIEVAVVDSAEGFGNGWRLPAGPLRESVRRLNRVDVVVHRGDALGPAVDLAVHAGVARRLRDPDQTRELNSFAGTPVHAVAGIAVPRRFFAQLRNAGLSVVEHAFPDHHAFAPGDFAFGDQSPVLMTQKDAVKCAAFAEDRFWVVTARAELDGRVARQVLDRLHSLRLERQHGQEAT
jgi:tetraacyldisaccharide 4'-kinase